MTTRCENCAFWDAIQRNTVLGVARCAKAVMLWDASVWVDLPNGDCERQVAPEHADQLMFVADGSDYHADLYTKPDFFCAHFTEKASQT